MIRTLYILTLVALMISSARGQSILGKHPADKVLPRFYQQNTNANTLVLGVNQSATVPFDLETPAFAAVKAAIGSGGSGQITNGPWLDTNTVTLVSYNPQDASGTNRISFTIPGNPAATANGIYVWGNFEDGIWGPSSAFTNYINGDPARPQYIYRFEWGSWEWAQSETFMPFGEFYPRYRTTGGQPTDPRVNWMDENLEVTPIVEWVTNLASSASPVIIRAADGSFKQTYDIAVSNIYVDRFEGDGSGLTNVNASVLNSKREAELTVGWANYLTYNGGWYSAADFANTLDLEYYVGEMEKLANNQVAIVTEPTPRSSYIDSQYSVWFNQPEVVINQVAAGPLYIEFTNYVNQPVDGNIVDYCSYTVIGTNIHVKWPAAWSPSTTNEYHFTNNGIVSFKYAYSNMFAAGYYP